MEFYEKLFYNSIVEDNLQSIKYCLSKGVNPNKIVFSGRTALGLAAEHGNFDIFVTLLENQRQSINSLGDKGDVGGHKMMNLDLPFNNKKKNIGYFVVCKDVEENELGEGPTPEGMEALEWDMEITNEKVDEQCLPSTPPEAKIYKWYADILNRSAIILQSPENDIARVDKYGQNALHYAVGKGHCDIVRYLLDNCKEFCIDQMTLGKYNSLHLASQNGCHRMVKLLIEKGANVNLTNKKKYTPLHLAAVKGHIDIINTLLENGADINACDLEERSPLSQAIAHVKTEASILLIKKGTRLNTEETNGTTLLQRAVWNNMMEVVRTLLSFGAKVVQSHFLLHWAIRHLNVEMFKLLHQYGAILNIKNENGLTPLMFSCMVHNLELVKYVLENGATANTRNDLTGLSALHICVEYIRDINHCEQFLELLLLYDADINSESYMGNVIFYAIICGNTRAACKLIKYGADVNARGGRGIVDNLTLAKKNGDLELLKLLIFAGFKCSIFSDLKSLKTEEDDPLYDFLIQINSNPLNLKDLCRIRIRTVLGKQLMQKIYRLPLPIVLLHYLALEEL